MDLRPQLLGLEYMDQTAVDAALEGKHIPIPSTPQPGTALLRFRGEYTGAGGLSVEGMAKILGAAAGKEVQVLHSHRASGSSSPSPSRPRWISCGWTTSCARRPSWASNASGIRRRG